MENINPFKPRGFKTIEKKAVKELTRRQSMAIDLLVEKGGEMSKAEILRQVGYSQSVINKPKMVFGSPNVQAVMEEAGLNPRRTAELIKNRLYYRQYKTVNIPLHIDDVEKDEKGKYKYAVSSLTDGDIMEIFTEVGAKVMTVEYRADTRVVWLSMKNTAAESDSLNKLVAIFGMEAPRKMDVKEEHTHVFSLSKLREEMDKRGIEPFKRNPNVKIHDQ